ncbi:MAG TPA: type II secretion system protein GspG [Candidatus Saccharimonadales bacterium]|nr:type II secretion system protein GspG [Candidatus Saccharimonadales bacterium]
MKSLKKSSGFTLIELLIVVAIIGIIAAIAIPNLLNAIDRGKQKRTMSDMRSIGTSVESYAVDVNFYPIQASLGNVAGTVQSVLQPIYIKNVPTRDGWSGQLLYACDAGGTGSDYTIVSYGKDKKASSGSVGATNDFDCDIIFENGTFTAYPEGVQT